MILREAVRSQNYKMVRDKQHLVWRDENANQVVRLHFGGTIDFSLCSSSGSTVSPILVRNMDLARL